MATVLQVQVSERVEVPEIVLVVNSRGECVCRRGTEGEPGNCQPIVIGPICPKDSVLNNRGQCVCKRGTEGEPGQCQVIEDEPEPKPIQCPKDSFLNRNGECVCNRGTVGEPGQCQPLLRLQAPIIKLN